jgi:putative beta-1,4-xylosyltransferase IRX10
MFAHRTIRLMSLSTPIVQEEKAIERGVLPLLRRATLVQTFGQKDHVCLKEGSITIPPYAPPQKMKTHLVPPGTPRSIFVYFRGLFYDTANDPEGGYYARYVATFIARPNNKP